VAAGALQGLAGAPPAAAALARHLIAEALAALQLASLPRLREWWGGRGSAGSAAASAAAGDLLCSGAGPAAALGAEGAVAAAFLELAPPDVVGAARSVVRALRARAAACGDDATRDALRRIAARCCSGGETPAEVERLLVEGLFEGGAVQPLAVAGLLRARGATD
jgi:hypothetical protein